MNESSQPPILSPPASIGFGLFFLVVGVMTLGVGLSQWRGRGHALFDHRAVRVIFGQEYGPRWFRTTRAPRFDYGLRIFGGFAFTVFALYAIVSGLVRL